MRGPNLSYSFKHYKLVGNSFIEESLDALPDSLVSCSFSDPCNRVEISFSSDTSLSRHEIRITRIDEEYGVGVGTLWNSKVGGLASNTTHTYSYSDLPVNSTIFGEDGTYRISLYAQSQSEDGIWDATYLLLTTESNGEHKIYAPTNYDGIELYYQGDIPTA